MLLVPLLGAAFPLISLLMAPLIASLASAATWMHEAGKRSATGAAGVLQRALKIGFGSEAQGQPVTIENPTSTFSLYVNTTAFVWFFGFMLYEVCP